MRVLNVAVTSGLFFAGIAWAAFPPPNPVKGDVDVHDPTMCKDGSGKYWLFSTGDGISIRTSPDRVTFTSVGKVFPDGTPWADPYTGGDKHLWAPECRHDGQTFHLLYAASSFGSSNSAIFYATSKTGLPGSFTNKGLVMASSDGYNAIDPNLLVVGGSWYLSFGSFFAGIGIVKLDPSTVKPTGGIKKIANRPGVAKNPVEASTVYKHGGDYFLFTSWDKCCQGTSSTYNIRVGKSSSPDSGFVDKEGKSLTEGGGTLLLGTHDNIVGPGGQDILDDGGPILVYHYYTSSGPKLGMNKLDFSTGWPVVI